MSLSVVFICNIFATQWNIQGDAIYCEIITPVGNLYETAMNIDNSFTVAEFFIKSREDIKIFQYVEEHKKIIHAYDEFIIKDEAIDDCGIATTSAPSTPLAQLFEFYMGLENFVYFLSDYASEMEELMAVMHSNVLQEHRIVAEGPSQAVFMYEDTSTTTISRDMYLAHCKSQIDQYADIVHGCGKTYFVHMCGKLKGFRDIIAENKMDGVDSLCPPETGDMWTWEANECWGDKIIIGGIDPTWIRFADKASIERQVRETIEKSKPGRRTILSTGDATAYGTPLESLKLITELVNKYGRY